ncbi:hypothetical protein ACFPPE_07440 [Agromyces tardus]|uniref:hypothetical protein n=1 Tax=Agromyces tardus TaxID=2583849 RepID=UPI003619A173
MNSHECRQGKRCKSRRRDDDGELHGAALETADSLCRLCEEEAFAAIRALPRDFALLADTSTNPTGTRSRTPAVRRTPGRSAPINLDAYELMAKIDDELLRWALRLDTDFDDAPRDPQQRVARCVAVLSTRLGTLVDQPTHIFDALLPHPDGGDYLGRESLNGVDAVLRLATYHRTAQGILGLTETSVSYLNTETCHLCGTRSLYAHLDEDPGDDCRIACRTCHHTWSQDEFTRLNNPEAA